MTFLAVATLAVVLAAADQVQLDVKVLLGILGTILAIAYQHARARTEETRSAAEFRGQVTTSLQNIERRLTSVDTRLERTAELGAEVEHLAQKISQIERMVMHQ